jgi:hypothetical protein
MIKSKWLAKWLTSRAKMINIKCRLTTGEKLLTSRAKWLTSRTKMIKSILTSRAD